VKTASTATTPPTTGIPKTESGASQTERKTKILTYQEKAAVAQDPEQREATVRWVARNYASLFAQLKLSPAKQELLEKILVDRLLAPEFSERAEYDRLAASLLTPEEYAALVAHREEIPIKAAVKGAIAAAGLGPGPDSQADRQAVERIIRSAPLNGDAIWRDASRQVERSGPLTQTELAALAAAALQRFEMILAKENLSTEQQQRLRAWFRKTVVDSNVRAYGP
jgi:tripartite-type tricarboxylate transporter receptor subunit TctC